MEEDNTLQLGGKIELSGFSELDGGSMIVLKKIVGNYVKRMSTMTDKFEGLRLTMKKVHDNQFELHAKVMNNGKPINSSVNSRNLFIATDMVLKKIISSLSK